MLCTNHHPQVLMVVPILEMQKQVQRLDDLPKVTP